MTDKNLENLLSEYEQKRRKAQMDAETKIEQLYEISKSKSILNGNNNLKENDNLIEKLKKKKQEFLKDNKINIDLFKPNYECKICNDTGYIQDENNKTIMCHCLKQKLLNLSYNKSNLSDIKNQNFDNFN